MELAKRPHCSVVVGDTSAPRCPRRAWPVQISDLRPWAGFMTIRKPEISHLRIMNDPPCCLMGIRTVLTADPTNKHSDVNRRYA